MICRLIVELPLKVLNVSSNTFTNKFYEKLSQTFRSKQISLSNLDISNNGMGDSNSLMVLLAALKYTQITSLNLSRNKLKYKFGYTILSVIEKIDVLHLKSLDLSYNSISESVLHEIINKLNNNIEHSTIQQEEASLPYNSIRPNKSHYLSSYTPSAFNLRTHSIGESASQNYSTYTPANEETKSNSFLEKRQLIKPYMQSHAEYKNRNVRSKSVYQIPINHIQQSILENEEIDRKIEKSNQKLVQAEKYISYK